MRSTASKVLALAFTFFTLCACSSSVFAQSDLWVHDEDGNLARVDVRTGDVEIIGNMGVTMTDIAFTPDGTTLFGVSFTNFYEINPVTAMAFDIGAHGITDANELVFDTDGTLFSASSNGTSLYEINPANGIGEVIGDVGFQSAGDLAFNDGELYLSSITNELIRVDLANGASGTPVGFFGFSEVFGLATANDGVLYGVSGTEIFSVNTSTGIGTFVSNYTGNGIGNSFGSAFVPEPVLLGDVNLDGVIDFSDIPAFIAILQSGGFQAEADCDLSGTVDFGDIPAFIAILISQ